MCIRDRVYAEHCLLCGRPDQAIELLGSRRETGAQFVRSAAWLLKGDLPAAIAGFEAALKDLRAASGRRSAIFSGLCGYLQVLALLRSAEAKLIKRAQSYIEQGLRTSGDELLAYVRLNYFSGVNLGTHKVNDRKQLTELAEPLEQLLAALIDHWLGLPRSLLQDLQLAELGLKSEAAGFDLITVAAAELLASSTSEKFRHEQAAFLGLSLIHI